MARVSHAEPKPDERTNERTNVDQARRATSLYATRVVKASPDEPRTEAEEEALASLASELDALLADAAQDLGLALDLGRRGAPPKDDVDLVGLAETTGGTCFAPSLRVQGDEVELRIALADASSREVRSRIERTSREDIAVRAVVMLRDLVTRPSEAPRRAPGFFRVNEAAFTAPKLSAGRTSLAVHATMFGGVVGYSIQRASGSEDPRLLYPLLAVGAGGGLVSSILVAEEWDIGVGDAWYLASGAWWPTVAGHLLYAGRFGASGHEGERWTSGLIAGTMGLSISTLQLAIRGSMSEGGALLAHTGGGFGLVLGGVVEALVRGDVEHFPLLGMGYGASLGWLSAAALAIHVRPQASRIVSIDLGALLGGLGGAALGSPFLFQRPTPTQQRLWVGMTGGMAVLGAGVGWFVTRSKPEPSKATEKTSFALPLPSFGVIGESVVGFRRAPVLGLSWGGPL